MKKLIFVILLLNAAALLTAPTARAVMTEYSTTNRTIAVTNILPASDVRPLAAYILFQSPATGSVAISRVTAKGLTVPLARHGFTNVAALTWFAPADFPIRRGEAFAVSSTVARFTLQLETTSDGGDVQRTDAPEWYDEGRPFTIQVAGGGGGSTQVTVTNTAQLFVTNTTHVVVTNSTLVVVTNAPQIVITNIVNVQGGGGGAGDNLGNHNATQNLNMAQFAVTNIADLEMTGFLDARGAFAVPQQYGEGTPYRNGVIFFDQSVNQFKGYNGSQYVTLGGGGTGGGDNLGNGIATSDVDLRAYSLTATADYMGYTVPATIKIHGLPANYTDGGSIELIAGGGHGYHPGSITIQAGGDVAPMNIAGGDVTIIGGNAQADSSGIGGNVTLQAGPGGNGAGEIVLVSGPQSNGGRGGIRLDFSGGGDLKLNLPDSYFYTGATEDVTVSGITFRFVHGIYIGHTGP